jgi:hypothetical protein
MEQPARLFLPVSGCKEVQNKPFTVCLTEEDGARFVNAGLTQSRSPTKTRRFLAIASAERIPRVNAGLIIATLTIHAGLRPRLIYHPKSALANPTSAVGLKNTMAS